MLHPDRPPLQPMSLVAGRALALLCGLASVSQAALAADLRLPNRPAAYRQPSPATQSPAAPASPPARPVRIEKSRTAVDGHVRHGQAHLQAGDLEAARRDYESALGDNPHSLDARLGLATVALRRGLLGEAQGQYRQALEIDPGNAPALAATIGMAAASDPVRAESRLKTLLAAQPESGPLHFSLGNVYSRQNLWPEAQQAYFNAVVFDGDNPDYLFNLAVSLDHLRQPALAVQHYRRALEAADRQPAAFDRNSAKARLQHLQSSPSPKAS